VTTLAEFVTRALRVPFLELGRDYDGWDCWGLVYVGQRDVFGLDLPRYDDGYGPDDARRGSPALRDLIAANMDGWVLVQDPRPGDVVLLRIAGRPVHVGLVVDARRFLHVEEGVGTFVERMDGAMWARRTEGVYRHVGA